jgi:ribonuclease D
VVIDPLALEDLSPLGRFLASHETWMHGADYDMSLMLGKWGMIPPFLYDTQIAAQLLGYERFGYASLVEECFGVELSKSSQKADWGKRPLSPKMLEYACDDVRYLLPLAQKMEAKLKEKGRFDWFLQSCEAARDRVIARAGEEKDLWRVGGSGRLRPEGLRFLKALWKWRDGEAASWNKPSFMVATNKELIEWSSTLAEGRQPAYRKKMRRDRRARLEEAVIAAEKLPKEEWPSKPKRERVRHDAGFESRLKARMEERNRIATGLKIDPTVIASRAILEQLVGGKATPEELLLPWQRALLEV